MPGEVEEAEEAEEAGQSEGGATAYRAGTPQAEEHQLSATPEAVGQALVIKEPQEHRGWSPISPFNRDRQSVRGGANEEVPVPRREAPRSWRNETLPSRVPSPARKNNFLVDTR